MDSLAGLAMDVGDSVAAQGYPHHTSNGLDADSNVPHKTQDWIEGCYNKLHAVSRALDNHLIKSEQSSHQDMETAASDEDGYEYYIYEHPDSRSRPESVGDPNDLIASDSSRDELNFMDFCKSDNCCYLHDEYDPPHELEPDHEGGLAPFDMKGKRFSKYLQDLRNEGNEEPFEETMPSDFPVPDALSIMDARMARIAELRSRAKDQMGDHDGQGKCSIEPEPGDQLLTEEENGLEMDTSLQEYLESDNDIMSHPLYKRLCAAHISLCKLGATDSQLKEMEELSEEIESRLPEGVQTSSSNPELDRFMNEYCDFLETHKKEFGKPFDEAMEFCQQIDEELATSSLRFLRDTTCSPDETLTHDTIARLQDLPLEGEV